MEVLYVEGVAIRDGPDARGADRTSRADDGRASDQALRPRAPGRDHAASHALASERRSPSTAQRREAPPVAWRRACRLHAITA